MKKWKILHKTKNIEHITNNNIIKILLNNRGIRGKKQIGDFLHPSLEKISFKSLKISKTQLNKAIERIHKAIENKESVVVYTDYDADGICGGAIIWETLHQLGAKVMPYVPHRINEGYGLSNIGIDQTIKEFNPDLIITVDHGISCVEQVDYSKKKGIETIILDHHVKPAKTPGAYSTVHTTRLCASGIAWFFSKYLRQKIKKEKPGENFLELAAIGTVADLVPLTAENRIIAKFGIDELNKTGRPGLLALFKESGLSRKKIGVYEIGHIIAPRINALGRLTHAIDALRLLCTRDEVRAIKLAGMLSSVNQDRQNLTAESTVQAINYVKKNLFDGENKFSDKLIFIAHESFHQGVIGLIAGKLVEEYYRPAIVVSVGKEFSKASARSVRGFNMLENIRRAAHLLTDAGGHPMAAGFTVETSKLSRLKEFLVTAANEEIPDDILERVIKIDTELDIDAASIGLFQETAKLAPFGTANPEPVFLSRNVDILEARLIGRDKNHLKLKLRREGADGNKIIAAIGFGLGGIYHQLSPDKPIDIVYTLSLDDWNGNNSLQLKLKDVNLSDNGFSSSR